MKLKGYDITTSIKKTDHIYYLAITATKGKDWYRIKYPFETKQEAESRKAMAIAINGIAEDIDHARC